MIKYSLLLACSFLQGLIFASTADILWSHAERPGYSEPVGNGKYTICYMEIYQRNMVFHEGLGHFRGRKCHFTNYWTETTTSSRTNFSFLRIVNTSSLVWKNSLDVSNLDKVVRTPPGGGVICRDIPRRTRIGFVKNGRCMILKYLGSGGIRERITDFEILTYKKDVKVFVFDSGEHGRMVESVLLNRAWPIRLTDFDQQYRSEVLFETSSEIKHYDYGHRFTKRGFNIVNASFFMGYSEADDREYLNQELFPSYPLIVTSGGNGRNTCSEEAYSLGTRIGDLSLDSLIQHYGCTYSSYADGTCVHKKDIEHFYQACDFQAANTIRKTDRGKNWIVVGPDFSRGQKPGAVLKHRWIGTYYHFNNGRGTSLGAPFVTKLAAEIKRRAPHYSNDEIAQLVFSTADDLGEPGVDDIYGNGRMNVKAALDELTRRGY